MSYYDILNRTPVNLSPDLREKFGVNRKTNVSTKERKKAEQILKKVGMFESASSTKPLRIFNTCYAAAKFLNIENRYSLNSMIFNMLMRYSYYNKLGYVWRFVEDDGRISYTNLPNPILKKKVGQFDVKTGELIKVWDTAYTICKELNVSSSCLYECLNNNRQTAYKFKWAYIDS